MVKFSSMSWTRLCARLWEANVKGCRVYMYGYDLPLSFYKASGSESIEGWVEYDLRIDKGD